MGWMVAVSYEGKQVATWEAMGSGFGLEVERLIEAGHIEVLDNSGFPWKWRVSAAIFFLRIGIKGHMLVADTRDVPLGAMLDVEAWDQS